MFGCNNRFVELTQPNYLVKIGYYQTFGCHNQTCMNKRVSLV